MFELLAAAAIAIAHQPAPELPAAVACQYEDGNTDGTACVWIDPDTGTQYYGDSSNY